jgi:uncharacterized protein
LRIVLDANVFISAFMTRGRTCELAMVRALREAEVIVPEQFIRDLYSFAGQLRKKRIRIDSDVFLAALNDLRVVGRLQVVSVRQVENLSPHEADNHYVSAAIEQNADLLLTGDQDLLGVREAAFRNHGIRILTPAEYLDRRTRD